MPDANDRLHSVANAGNENVHSGIVGLLAIRLRFGPEPVDIARVSQGYYYRQMECSHSQREPVAVYGWHIFDRNKTTAPKSVDIDNAA